MRSPGAAAAERPTSKKGNRLLSFGSLGLTQAQPFFCGDDLHPHILLTGPDTVPKLYTRTSAVFAEPAEPTHNRLTD